MKALTGSLLLLPCLIAGSAAIAAEAQAQSCKIRNSRQICIEECGSNENCASTCQRADMIEDCQYAWFSDDGTFKCASQADYPAACRKRPSSPSAGRPEAKPATKPKVSR